MPRHSRFASGLFVTAIAVIVSLASTLLGHPTTRFLDHTAMSLLAADGFRARFVDSARPAEVVTLEWARDETMGLLQSGPELFGYWYGHSSGDAGDVSYARITETHTGGRSVGHVDTLLSVGAAGVRTHAVQGRSYGAVYLPGKLTLDADLTHGSTWSSSGELIRVIDGKPGQPAPYRSESRATSAAESALSSRNCLDISEREQVGDDQPTQSVTTWCPGEGIVATADSTRTLRRAASAPAPAGQQGQQGQPAGSFDWDTVDQLRWATRQVSQVGNSLVFQSPVAPPAVLPDGTLVYANRSGSDLVAVGSGRPEPTVWRARPGGAIVTAATIGTTTIAVTSERRVVAYGADGQWLWTTEISDIARVAPQTYADGVLVTHVDGTVQLLDADDGTVRWRYSAVTEIRVAPAVSGDAVIVADQSGRFVRLDPSGTVVWSMQHTKADAMAVVGETLVVAPHLGSTLSAFGMDDGGPVWRLRPEAAYSEVASLGGLLVVRSADSVTAYDATTGAKRWSRSIVGLQLTGGAGRIVVVTARDLVVLAAASGEEVTRVPLDLGDLSQNSFHIATGRGRLVVTTSTKAAVGSLP